MLTLNITVAAAGAMVIVRTVVPVRVQFGLGAARLAGRWPRYGACSMAAALVLLRLLRRRPKILESDNLLSAKPDLSRMSGAYSG